MKIALVLSRYYAYIAAGLEAGARDVCEKAGAIVEVVEIPGALEIPAAIAWLDREQRYDGYIALGCVIRGETTHYDHICDAMTWGLMHLTIEKQIAIGNGVLTVENESQALVRADTKQKNKGGEAAQACLKMVALKQSFVRNLG